MGYDTTQFEKDLAAIGVILTDNQINQFLKYYELLVGGRIDVEPIAFFRKHRFQFLRQIDGVGTNAGIQVIGKQGIKLHPYQTAFGEHGTLLFYHGAELPRHITVREHHRFPTQGAHFGATDIKHVAQFGKVLQRYVGTRRH